MQLKTISDLEKMDLVQLGNLRINDFRDKSQDFIVSAHSFFNKLIDGLHEGGIPMCESKTLKQLKLIKVFLKTQKTPA